MPLLHANHGSKSLSPTEIQLEARRLDEIADWFLSGDHESDAFHAWHKRLAEIAKYGMASVKEVFDQIQSTHDELNPLSVCVNVSQYGENVEINVASSRRNMSCGGNYRDIGGIVGTCGIFSAADAGQHPCVRQRHLTAFTKAESASFNN